MRIKVKMVSVLARDVVSRSKYGMLNARVRYDKEWVDVEAFECFDPHELEIDTGDIKDFELIKLKLFKQNRPGKLFRALILLKDRFFPVPAFVCFRVELNKDFHQTWMGEII